ncbi:BTAD domain-containing putative transcriptional regulator [Glycomyces sp. YM15]|uniref:AfsR/SARP family transcriptional regulator n=1 Tax=Glycomyces sp. YM15 TaxID=2800446 RepID=UPI0019659EE3|nr:BTAD domain-containing putative transcriptional regulator [Glycomyces sp. YM15]
MPHLDVRLLGPLELSVDGAPVAIPRGNTATVLAILLDEANSVVPLENIVRAVYGHDIPQDPETQVQNTIGVLRRKLGAARDRVETVGRAYRFRIDAAELDTLRCKTNEDRARSLRAEGRFDEAVAALREALGEWRGPALANLSGSTSEAIRRRYDEHRLALLERRIDLDLELGRAAEVVDELRQIVAVHGTRQRFTALLMRALQGAGRTAEALEAYAALKERLADELGADPDQAVRDLHTAILRDGPSTAVPDAPPATDPLLRRRVPAMLPRANTRFTGRTGQMRLLDDFLEAGAGTAGLAVVTGMGGVGKTALAVSWAHRVAHRFPDGQLYFNLRGFDPLAPGTDAATVLGEALVVLGVEAHQLPAGLDERIGLYRTVLAGRRVLVVLDNARDAAQVRPLLPVAPGSFTLVTSRDRLAGLDVTEGADVLPLDLLPDADAWALLVRRIGMSRAMEEERAVKRIVTSCGRLPLALTLIGAWAATHPQFSLASLADRLDTTTNVLGIFATSDSATDPRSVFACSYQALSSRSARAFRFFGLHPGPELTVPAMASLMGVPPAEAEAALLELADVHLVDQPREGRYAMHDLLRSYAAERLRDEVAPAERDAAEIRLIDYFIHSAHAADAQLTFHGDTIDVGEPAPGVTPEPVADMPAAADWFATEYEVLLGLLRREPAPGGDARFWLLAWCTAGYMLDRSFGVDLMETQTAAFAAAERAGDGFGQVISLGYLSAATMLHGDQEYAARLIERAMSIADDLEQPWAKGFVCYGLAVHAAREDDDAQAAEYAGRALAYFDEAGDRIWTYRASWTIAWHEAVLGGLDAAKARYDDLMAISLQVGAPLAVAHSNLGLGHVAHRSGRLDDALRHYALAREGFKEYGQESNIAFADELVGDVLDSLGDSAGAESRWRFAEEVYRRFRAQREFERVTEKLAQSVDAMSIQEP